MKSNVTKFIVSAITTLVVFSCLTSVARADHQKTVNGIIVNIGVVPAGRALDFSGEAATHDKRLPSGAQHLVVSLSDAKLGTHIADAKVTVEIKDPKGNLEKKVMVPAKTAGTPDYSEIFGFGYSGKYVIRVVIVRKDTKKLLKVNFTWEHQVI